MIVKLHKYLLFGPKKEMDGFFDLAQKAGFIEFIGIGRKKALEMPSEAKTILSAIKVLKEHGTHGKTPDVLEESPIYFANRVLEKKEEFERLSEEERILEAESARIAPFGDFSKEELLLLEKGGKRQIQFFCMKSDLAREKTLPPNVIYIGTEYDLDYFLSIQKERVDFPEMVEILIDKPIGEVKKKLRYTRIQIAQLEREIHEAATFLPLLQRGLLGYLNDYQLQMTKNDVITPLRDALFAIEAWVPETKIKALQGLIGGLKVEAVQIAIEKGDRIPTYQENRGFSRVGEDLVHVYDTPAASDKDPSLWVLVFFALFFAMIIADAGYGLIYLAVGFFLKWKCKKPTAFLKRFIKLVFITSLSCIVWGTLTASFFGIEIGPNNPFRKVSFLHYMARKKAEYHLEKKDDVYKDYAHRFPQVASARDGHDFLVKTKHIVEGRPIYQALNDFYDSILLEISLFVGMVHISFSFLRNSKRNWAGLGWIVFMIGGYLYFPLFLDATSFLNFLGVISKAASAFYGKYLLYSGLGLVFLLSLLEGKKWGALHEVTNAIQVFADVLSYLRLYALALAGMIMASTFNELGMEAGIFGGTIIILLGHLTNLTLAVMSGVIHGLRLNFLEWYHYSFEGGGRAFDPLRIRKN